MHILFQLFFVLIDCSTILVPSFWYYWRYKSDKFSITVNGSSGWKWIFRLVFPDLAFLPILPETVSSKSLFNHDFIIESIFANYKKNFMYPKDSYNSFTEISFSPTISTAKYRNATLTTYSEILVPNTPVLKIIMSILLSISGSTGFRVWIFESIVPRAPSQRSASCFRNIR